MNRTAHRVCAVALFVAAACTHAPATPEVPAWVWPAPPAAPRIRLAGVFPDPDGPAPVPSLWRRVVATVAGTEPPEAQPAAFEHPFGIAVSSDGSYLVADPELQSLTRVSGGHAEGILCDGRAWGSPTGVATEPEGSLLVADGSTIVRIAADGRCSELGPARFERASGIAVAGGRVFVSDPPRHEVVILSPAGEILGRLGGAGAGQASLHFPSAVASTSDGSLLVTDTFGFSIARWGPDGLYAGRIGGASDTAGGLVRPKGVASGSGGRVVVSDAERDELVVYSPDGKPEFRFGSTGSGPGRFAHPAGLATAGDRLFVADSLNGRVQIFEFLGGHP